jgi:hypothetical protein
MQVLSFRSDLIRGNIVYGGFELTRMAVRARRHRVEKMAMAQRTEPVAPIAGASVAAVNGYVDRFDFNDN